MKFSQRIGILPLSKTLQIEEIDDELRNGLWNVYQFNLINVIERLDRPRDSFETFFKALWHHFYKLRSDTIPYNTDTAQKKIVDMYFSYQWFEVYDFIEFIASMRFLFNFFKVDTFVSQCNAVLERENSGYRFLNYQIVPITNELEISQIEETIQKSSHYTAFKGANLHIASALKKLSDRQNPDYRNSIKESISAVESVAKKISGKDKDSLGSALQKIKGKVQMHPSLERGFLQIYGYTSDGDGIRHGLMNEPNCDFEDAKFMLVSCSAFINYLIVKADKAGIPLS